MVETKSEESEFDKLTLEIGQQMSGDDLPAYFIVFECHFDLLSLVLKSFVCLLSSAIAITVIKIPLTMKISYKRE